jgi:hypothetical protein
LTTPWDDKPLLSLEEQRATDMADFFGLLSSVRGYCGSHADSGHPEEAFASGIRVTCPLEPYESIGRKSGFKV